MIKNVWRAPQCNKISRFGHKTAFVFNFDFKRSKNEVTIEMAGFDLFQCSCALFESYFIFEVV